jgi:endonuclease/exonuclease/phosphatase (EEP) superfamily protein YafD
MFPEFAFDGAANIEYAGKLFGVQTASRVVSKKSQAYITETRESLVLTRKSLILSEFAFGDNSTLLVLNVHAINFRENRRYNYELDKFLEYVQEHKGPMIIAGDFNSWSAKRLQKLERLQNTLSLKAVNFEEKDRIKSFRGYQLDHIFYRDLELLNSTVVDAKGLSDHSPLFAEFGYYI